MTRTQANTYVKDYIDSMKAMEFEIDAEFELVKDDTVPGYVYEEDVEDDQDLIAFLTELK